MDLTYVKQGSESDGDAGDKYTGLDRFGRVADQRWINEEFMPAPTAAGVRHMALLMPKAAVTRLTARQTFGPRRAT